MGEPSSFDSLSVIIPTYNRKEVLIKALEGYLAQSSPRFIHEIIIVDDGSTDGTERMVTEFAVRSEFSMRYFRQPNQGPAAARNLGIRQATSNLLLFTDSDIIPGRDLVKRHIDSHRQNPLLTSAVLGYVTWAEEMKALPFMRWYGEHMLFGFNGLRGLSEASFRQFYTCNVSLKTEFLRTNGQFDEDFKTAAYEDAELGFRLDKKGMRLLYNPAAIAYHYQRFSFQEACQKRLKNAAAAHTFSLKEAGLQLAQEEQQRRSKVAHALVERLAPWIAKILYPLRWFLDSAIALPGIVYHLFFWLDTRPADRAK